MLPASLPMRNTFGVLLVAFAVAGCNTAPETPTHSAEPVLESVSPDRWARLATQRVFFAHKSVGLNVVQGIQEISQQDSRVRVRLVETREPRELLLPGFAHAQNGVNGDPLGKIAAFRSALESGLAEKLDVSEAALYRHFASKAQMYEGLIEFIESSVFTVANKITEDESDGRRQAEKLVEMLLAFAEKNPGMVRVMTGDALVGEHERLQARMNQFFDRFEATLKQALRAAADGDAAVRAATLLRYAIGCLHQYAKSGFAKKPIESFSAQRRYLLA